MALNFPNSRNLKCQHSIIIQLSVLFYCYHGNYFQDKFQCDPVAPTTNCPAKLLPLLAAPTTHNKFLACGLLNDLKIKAGTTSETSVNFYQTARHDILDDSHLHCQKLQNVRNCTLSVIRIQDCRTRSRESTDFDLSSRHFGRIQFSLCHCASLHTDDVGMKEHFEAQVKCFTISVL